MPLTYTPDAIEIVNDFTPDIQQAPVIAMLADGGWVVAYVSYGVFSTTASIVMQRYDSQGNRSGPETLVSDAPLRAAFPVIEALPNGGWVIAWEQLDTGSNPDVVQQVFSAQGEALGTNLMLSQTPTSELRPQIAVLADGGWITVWQGPDYSQSGILFQRFDSDGVAIGTPVFAADPQQGTQVEPKAIALTDGGWLVAWQFFDNGATGALFQRFDATGEAVGGPVPIAHAADAAFYNLFIAATSDGGWVICSSQYDPNSFIAEICAEKFSAGGVSAGLRTIVGDGAHSAVAYALEAHGDGGFAVSFDPPEGGAGGVVQTFDAFGNPTSLRMATGNQALCKSFAIAADGSMQLVFVGADDVYQQHFQPDIYGTAGANTLRGTVFAETIVGFAGNDKLIGGGGEDILDGGLGDDTYTVDSAGDLIREMANQGLDKVLASVTYSLVGTAAENLTLTGTLAIDGTGNALGNALTGNAAGNVLVGLGGADAISGSAGDDQLFGGAGDDLLAGGRGDDLLDGDSGFDTVRYSGAGIGVTISLAVAGPQSNGGEGSDTLVGIEHLIGSNFADTLTGSAINNTIEGGNGNDVLFGAQGSDTASYAGASAGVTVSLALAGAQDTIGAGVDTLSGFENLQGSAFNDRLTGNGGNNTLIGGRGNDILDGAGGSDFASYVTAASGVTVSLSITKIQETDGAGQDTLVNIENLRGSDYDDALTGSGLANILVGRGGADVLVGGGGSDTLDGGSGLDLLRGGIGADLFVFAFGDTGRISGAADRILDFSHAEGDRIDLSAIDADVSTAGDQAFSFIGANGFTNVAGQLRVYEEGADTFIAGDTNADGYADFVIRFDGAVAIAGSDFVL